MLDRNFLKQLDNFTQREVYAKIISLDWNENAIAEITGNIVSGNISVDGSSATRRTCSLTVISDNKNAQLNETDWGLKTKFAVLVGLKNFIDKIHDDIIWFQQGVFICTSFSQTSNNQGITINIQGKDKMSMLDGSIGGTLFAEHDFGSLQIINEDGSISKQLLVIQDIIKYALHTYALESYENIIITDLDECAVELLDYKIRDKGLFIYDLSVDPQFKFYTSQMVFEGQGIANKFAELAPKDPQGDYIENQAFKIDELYYKIVKYCQYGDTAGYRETDLTYAGNGNGELIVEGGGAVTSALDKIVGMLGEFEYFYDIYGRFIFQRKKIYHNINWNGAIMNEGESTYYDSLTSTQSQYEFTNGILIDSYSNKPILTNIRNDFIIWGKTNNDYPIHLRYAIDERPTYYTSLSTGITYYSEEDWRYSINGSVYFQPILNNGLDCSDISINSDYFISQMRGLLKKQNISGNYNFYYVYTEDGYHRWQYILTDGRTIYTEYFGFSPSLKYAGRTLTVTVDLDSNILGDEKIQLVDWREIIYQMAYDNSKSEANIYQLTAAMNRQDSESFKPYKKTAVLEDADNIYYYDSDDKYFRLVRNIIDAEEKQQKGKLLFGRMDNNNKNLFQTKSYVELISEWQDTWNTGYDQYYADILAFWRLIYDIRSASEIEKDLSLTETEIKNRIDNLSLWQQNGHWDPDIIYFNIPVDPKGNKLPGIITFKDPGSLIFWMDFIGEDSDLSKYKISQIGCRPKVINDDDVKAIFFRDTPDVLFIDPTNTQPTESTLNYVKLNLVGGLVNYFTISGQGKSAKEVLDNLVYDCTYYQETITLNSLPIYYLEPNTRISVFDDTSNIKGEYFIKSFNYSFAYDGTMSITATRAADKIL